MLRTHQAIVTSILCAFLAPRSSSCTSAVILGSATRDGRPLLWKNRDTKDRNNEIVHFASVMVDGHPTFAFVAVTNAGSPHPWAGLNEAGFAVINTLTRDMKGKAPEKGPGNAGFMRLALRSCRTVSDFERLLRRTDGKRRTIATFAVIDAAGRGATFETGPDRFVAFDASDPRVARASCAKGVVVRTNFTFTANGISPGERPAAQDIDSKSYRRFARAEELLGDEGKIDLATLLQRVVRDHDLDAGTPRLLDTRETISRLTTVSAIVIHGAKPGEDPRTATMWVLLGEPSLSVAIPTWVAMGKTSPLVDGETTSPLCDVAERIRAQLYVETQNGPRLEREALPTLWRELLPTEEEILAETSRALDAWRSRGVDGEDMFARHETCCRRALVALREGLNAIERDEPLLSSSKMTSQRLPVTGRQPSAERSTPP